jgi:hypothetical protein
LLFAACSNPAGGGNSTLTGAVKIQKGVADVTEASTGDTLTAVYSGTETVSYQWKRGGTGVGTGDTYSPAEAGSYTVTVSAAGYQSKTSAAITVTGLSLPALAGTVKIQKDGVDVTSASAGDTLTAVYSGSEDVSYQWNRGGTAVGTSQTYVLAAAGSYTVTVSAADYQSKTSAPVTVTGSAVDPSILAEGLYEGGDLIPVNLSGVYEGYNTLDKALAYIRGQTLTVPTNYTIVLAGYYLMNENANIDNANAVITLVGKPATEISLFGQGWLFYITAGKLVLDNNITLKGDTFNDRATVFVDGSSAALTMKAGTKITGNPGYGGVNVDNSGSFTMEGGEISGNIGYYGDYGVNVDNSGSFTMSGGRITGRVFVYGISSFTMSGGEIPGGVSVYGSGSFTMSGGEITGNPGYGSVSVGDSGSFTMSGGKISGNSDSGVNVGNSGSFTMSGGEISGNSAHPTYNTYGLPISGSGSGGGVYVDGGSFTMEGGVISGNSSAAFTYPSSSSSYTDFATSVGGGGVYVTHGGSFTMRGGKISGNSASPSSYTSSYSDSHTSSYGGGVYVAGGGSFIMEDGEISNNSAAASTIATSSATSSATSYSYGGGVYVGFISMYGSGSFTMRGGKISGNSITTTATGSSSYSSSRGGGVYVASSPSLYGGSFTMEGGEISGNSAVSSSSSAAPYSHSSGGGVYVAGSGYENRRGSFTMSGGEISGNSVTGGTTTSGGGGVYVDSGNSGNFSKTGASVIYGNTGGAKANTVTEGDTLGHAVSYGSTYYRDATLNAGDNISTDDTLPENSGDTVGNWTKK